MNNPRYDYTHSTVVDTYDEIRFGGFRGKLFAYLQERHFRRLVRQASPRRLLDVATGTGRMLLTLPRELDICVGADTSRAMLSAARRKLTADRRSTSLVMADASQLAVLDRSFDCVTCIKLLHLMTPQEQDRVLVEMSRVTRRFMIFSIPIDVAVHRSSTNTRLNERLAQLGITLRTVRYTLRHWSTDSLVLASVDHIVAPTAASVCCALKANGVTHDGSAHIDESQVVIVAMADKHCFRIDVKHPNGGNQYFAKICPRYNDINAAEVELEHLKSLESLFGGSAHGFGVPRPVGLLHDSNALLTEYVPGVPLIDTLKKQLSLRMELAKESDILETIGKAGDWLRIFHSAGTRDARGQRFAEYFAKISRHDLRALENSMVLRRPLQKYLIAWGRIESEAHAQQVVDVRLHGDFGPPNILVSSDGRVTVVDLSSLWNGNALFDVATFLVALRVSVYKPSFTLFRRSFIDTMEAAFLRRYGVREDSQTRRALAFYSVCALIHACAQQTRILENRPRIVRWPLTIGLHLFYRALLRKELYTFEATRGPDARVTP